MYSRTDHFQLQIAIAVSDSTCDSAIAGLRSDRVSDNSQCGIAIAGRVSDVSD
jgi:hypothetical protein